MAAKRFLIVEDEPMIAMLVEDSLEDMGHRVAAICHSVDTALSALAEHHVDAAILDIHLGQQTSWPVARALQEANVPYMVSSGNADVDFPEGVNAVSILAKPFTHSALEDAVGALISS